MKKVGGLPGQRIDRFAELCIMRLRSNRNLKTAGGGFNGIRIIANKRSTVQSIVANYSRQLDERIQFYHRTAEGQARLRESLEQKTRLQATADSLMPLLDELDLSDPIKAMDWLRAMQEPSDYTGVNIQKEIILSKFKSYGYLPDVNCGDDFKENDEQNHAEWIIGQALLTLKLVSIHHMYYSFCR